MDFTQDTLINRYLQAVGFWLPRAQKDDILAELSADLDQQIEDRQEELGRSLTDADIKQILKRRGQPMLVACSFLPQRSLISPVVYPIYLVVLKIVLLVTLGISLVTTMVAAILSHGPDTNPGTAILHYIGSAWNVAFLQFGIITLIFAMIDRYANFSVGSDDWDPGKLNRVRPSQTAKKRVNLVTELIFGVIGLVWLIEIPTHPFLLVGPATLLVKPAPIWAGVYIPLLVLAMAGITENVVSLLRPDLHWLRPSFRILSSLFCLWIGYHLLQTHVYILPLDANAAKFTTMMNQILRIGVAGTMAGFGIAICAHLWELAKGFTQSMGPANVSLA